MAFRVSGLSRNGPRVIWWPRARGTCGKRYANHIFNSTLFTLFVAAATSHFSFAMLEKNETNNSIETFQDPAFQDLLGWAISYAVVAIAVIVGNSLTIAAFSTNRKLAQSRTNYFVVSLGIADFMVGACSIPMYAAELLFYHFQEERSTSFHEIYLPVDAFMGFASIFTLVAIALDRAYSVFFPHKHKTITKATYLCEIALVWCLAACVATLRLISNFTNRELLISAFNYSVIIGIFISLIVISLAYSMIWHRFRNPLQHHHRNTTAQEKKLAVTLSIITFVFVLTWIPFYIMNIFTMFCTSCYVLELVYFAKFLHYSNSFANFIVYALKIREFRRTVVGILCGRRRFSRNPKKPQINLPPGRENISIIDIQIELNSGAKK